MDVPALILEAMEALKTDQAGLARRLGVAQPTVSKWKSGQVRPDYESCLRLAQITGKSAGDVLRAAGRDPSLLPSNSESSNDTRAELLQYKRRFTEIRELLLTITGPKQRDLLAV